MVSKAVSISSFSLFSSSVGREFRISLTLGIFLTVEVLRVVVEGRSVICGVLFSVVVVVGVVT